MTDLAGVDALHAERLTKRYGAVLALDDLTLGVRSGSRTALVGPNGAGKSTLLRCWMGFERPSSGAAAVFGKAPTGERGRTLGAVAYLAQTPALYAELSVAEHLTLVAHWRGRGFSDADARRRLDDLGINPQAKAGQLSGGQAAQLGLALAIGTRAAVILLDEPLAHLDPLARRAFLEVLRDHENASGSTVVMSSNIVSDVERACDRVLVINHGRLLLDGSIHELAPGGAADLEDLVIERLAAPVGP